MQQLSLEASFLCRKLDTLLAQQHWEAADRETALILLTAAGREANDWLWLEDMEHLSQNILSQDILKFTNHLWLKYSSGRFGFSVQRRLWQREAGNACDERLGDRVGWRHPNGTWLTREEITFAAHAPRGHLPLTFAWWVEGAGIVLGGWKQFSEVVSLDLEEAEPVTTLFRAE